MISENVPFFHRSDRMRRDSKGASLLFSLDSSCMRVSSLFPVCGTDHIVFFQQLDTSRTHFNARFLSFFSLPQPFQDSLHVCSREQKRIPRRIGILVFHIGSFRNQRFPDSPGCVLFRSGFCRIQGNVCTVDPSHTRFPERTSIENIDQKRFGIRVKLLCGTDCPTCFIGKPRYRSPISSRLIQKHVI